MIRKDGIPKLPGEIRDAVDKDRFVVFIGAGVSALVGCMRWPDLAKHLADECFKKDCINFAEKEQLQKDSDYLKVISVAYELLKIQGHEKHFYQELEKALTPKSDNPNSCVDIYNRLWKFRGAFVTTNADKCFHKNFNPENILRQPKEFLQEGIKKCRLYKIHGCQESTESLIFKAKDYLRRYSSRKETDFYDFMKQLFDPERIILFIGYSLREFQLLSLLIPEEGEGKEYSRFALMPYYKHDQNLLKFDRIYFKTLGVSVLEYYVDEKGYTKLYDIIKRWSDELFGTTKLAHEDRKLIDEVVK